MEIFFHTRNAPNDPWHNEGILLSSFARLPVAGEFIQLSNETGKGDWHRVDMVCHVAFKAEYVAEIYCTATEMINAFKAMDANFRR